MSDNQAECKYCRYCGNTTTLMSNAYIHLEKKNNGSMYITNDCRLHFCSRSGRIGTGARINNCPMCGRELPEMAKCTIESLPEQPAESEKREESDIAKRLLALMPSLKEESYTIADIDEIIESLRSGFNREIHIFKDSKSDHKDEGHNIPARLARIEMLEELRAIKLLEAEEDTKEP